MGQRIGARNLHTQVPMPQTSPQMLCPTYKQRNEDFRKLFSKLPEAERLIVGESPCSQPQFLTLAESLWLLSCLPDGLWAAGPEHVTHVSPCLSLHYSQITPAPCSGRSSSRAASTSLRTGSVFTATSSAGRPQ